MDRRRSYHREIDRCMRLQLRFGRFQHDFSGNNMTCIASGSCSRDDTHGQVLLEAMAFRKHRMLQNDTDSCTCLAAPLTAGAGLACCDVCTRQRKSGCCQRSEAGGVALPAGALQRAHALEQALLCAVREASHPAAQQQLHIHTLLMLSCFAEVFRLLGHHTNACQHANIPVPWASSSTLHQGVLQAIWVPCYGYDSGKVTAGVCLTALVRKKTWAALRTCNFARMPHRGAPAAGPAAAALDDLPQTPLQLLRLPLLQSCCGRICTHQSRRLSSEAKTRQHE